jgi:multidrug transporter EmrE-like cation transporter
MKKLRFIVKNGFVASMGDGSSAAEMTTFILAIFSVSLNAAAQIFLRKTMVGVGPLPDDWSQLISYAFAIVFNPWFIAGMACYAVSIGVWLIVLSKLEVSVAYPLLSVGYVITTLVGFLFLGENVTLLRVFGIALICGGLLFVARTA